MSDKKSEENSYGFATNAIHFGQNPEKWDSRAVVPPLVLSSIYKYLSPGVYNYDYSAGRNPTRETLESTLASLEKAKYSLTFASGLGAVSSLSFLLKANDHILAMDNIYGGTSIYFQNFLSRFNVETTFVDMLDLEKTENGLRDNTAMVWFESPSNPLLKLVDIKAVCDIVKRKNPNITVVVDNTFATGYFQNPLELGADIVMHSLTKYMNGHSDVVMGAIMLNDEAIYNRMIEIQAYVSAVPSVFDCYMVIRGLKTLAVRMKEHAVNALAIAQVLEANPRVEKVIYPGLESHPQYELYKRQMKGFGGMISFFVKGGLEEAKTFATSLKIFTLAVSLGGPESLVDIPVIMSKQSTPREVNEMLGITGNLIRMSIGLEDVHDLINDLNQALEKAIII